MTALPGALALGLQQAALLVDADNFSDGPALESAWAQLQERAGRVSVCRAYGAPTRLQSLAGVWRSLGARTFPNLALDKNTTDAALIADAVALHFQQDVRLFAIASGDADFAPLAVRLREWGCEVWCFSMEGILFAGAQAYYDRVVRCAPSSAANAESPAPKSHSLEIAAAAVTAVIVPAALPVPPPVAKSPQLAPRFAPTALTPVLVPARVLVKPKPTPVVQLSAKPAPSLLPKVAAQTPALPEDVERILKVVPGLREAPQQLNQVVPVLRQKNILGKTTKSTAFFACYAAHFKLTPVHQPTHLSYVPACVVSTVPVRSLGAEIPVLTTKVATPAVLSWPVAARRKMATQLSPELHGLRLVLLQLALRRVTVANVLLAVPELLHGQPCALSAVAGRLRQHGMLRSCDSALRILERYPGSFAVGMCSTPQTVIYLR